MRTTTCNAKTACKLGARRYCDYSDKTLQAAVHAVKSGKMSSYKAAEKHGIPRRTIVNKVKGWHSKPFGKPTVRRNGIH